MRVSQVLPFAALASAAAVKRQEGGCTNPEKRVEFRSLDAALQKEYTDAVVCLTTKPSKLSFGLNTTLYDDFTYVHVRLNNDIHYVSQFLPWHRMFTDVYHKHLQACGYTGPMAYWDWTADAAAGDVASSSFLAAMGGNGARDVVERPADVDVYCVTEGPFKDVRPAYLRLEHAPHCLARNFNNGTAEPGDMRAPAYAPALMRTIHDKETFDDFELYLENIPHGSIHSAVGGPQGDLGPPSSPNDPIFFLHHAQIDRVWWQWQQADPDVRNAEYTGAKTQDKNGPKAALADVMPFMGLVDDLAVADVMTTQNDVLCYTY